MHVENELVEFVTTREQEYEEVIEEYEKEIFVPEEASEPPMTDIANNPPAQDKPRCIALILNDHWIYIYIYMCVCDVHLRYRIYIETICIDKHTYESY